MAVINKSAVSPIIIEYIKTESLSLLKGISNVLKIMHGEITNSKRLLRYSDSFFPKPCFLEKTKLTIASNVIMTNCFATKRYIKITYKLPHEAGNQTIFQKKPFGSLNFPNSSNI